MRFNLLTVGWLGLVAASLLTNPSASQLSGVACAEVPKFSLRESPEESSLKVPADLTADIVLQHPLIGNPLYMHFDGRGRLWLVEYRQYPWPAGLRLLSRDAVWRNRYEPPFAPPPPHPEGSAFRGRDRISIHEDTNGDGTFDRSKIFLDGLNFATAALPGRGGVFVMNPPYLLFYADRNQDDLPDDETPRILLSGFGIEDSHSIANSLRWGPDGWIYATQGSTVSGAIQRHGKDNRPLQAEPPVHSLGQNIWRYHPEKHRYEIFAEGGGNAFGVEIDSLGRTYSGHNGGNTRGFHYIQGGYYQKTFGKHGELSNPFAFGYFPDMRHHDVKRFTHTFAIYESTEFPARYHNKLFGVNPIENYVVLSQLLPDGSSLRTEDIANVLQPSAGDRADWFTPVDIQLAPDGSLFVADWFSVQANHYRNHEGETNPDLGRVIRLRGREMDSPQTIDLESIDSRALVDQFLTHPNRWYRQQALRILADRRDATVASLLLTNIRKHQGQLALESLWALHLTTGLSKTQMLEFFEHPNPHVRRWTVRLWGDFPNQTDDRTTSAVAELAATETDVEVMSQIVCTAKRLPATRCAAILRSVLQRDEFANDIHLPLAIWWAMEKIADNHELVLSLFTDRAAWELAWKPADATYGSNLVRRYVTQGDQSSLLACGKLLSIAPDRSRSELETAFSQALEGRSLPPLPEELQKQLAKSKGIFATTLEIRQGNERAIRKTLEELDQGQLTETDAQKLIGALADQQALPELTVPKLLKQLQRTPSDSSKLALLVALQKFDHPTIGKSIAAQWQTWSTLVQPTAEYTMASRSVWADYLLDALETDPAWKLQPETIERLRLHRDPDLQKRLAKRFPQQLQDITALELQLDRLLQVVSQGQGQPLSGQELFFTKAQCGKCHQLFSRGGDVGPDLTPYNRNKIRDILLAVVHPSAEIREGYENHIAITTDGQVITGLKVEANDQIVVLRSSDGQNHTLATKNIAELEKLDASLMPAGLIDQLTEDELRDLFAYLVSTTPPK